MSAKFPKPHKADGQTNRIVVFLVKPISFFHFADAPDRVRVKGPSKIRFDESARFTCLATPSRPAPDLKWRVGVEGQVRGQLPHLMRVKKNKTLLIT